MQANIQVFAILDSGIKFDLDIFRDYDIRNFDLTGEGPYDLNGHGTMVASIALGLTEEHKASQHEIDEIFLKVHGVTEKQMMAHLPTSIVLNIKIMNKFLELDEVTLLQGLETACEQIELISGGKGIVNLSAGVIREKREDCYTCRRFRQLARRNPNILFVVAAGNDGVNLDTIDKLYVPHMCDGIEVAKDDLLDEIFEDAVYFAQKGRYDTTQHILSQIINSDPNENKKQEVLALNRTVLFIQFGLAARSGSDSEAAQKWFDQAKEHNRNFLDISKI